MVMWTLGGLEACLFWSCIVVIVVIGLKSSEELSHLPQWVRTLINRPMGRFAWTNHIYFQITQPGSRTVTPLYQEAAREKICLFVCVVVDCYIRKFIIIIFSAVMMLSRVYVRYMCFKNTFVHFLTSYGPRSIDRIPNFLAGSGYRSEKKHSGSTTLPSRC
jgi:hypothetical protein